MDSLAALLAPLISAIPLGEIGAVLVRNEFNAIWCGLTVAYFLLCLVSLVWRAWPIRAALGRVTKALRGVEGPEDFAREFETYRKKVGTEKCLRHSWAEFRESLITPREGEPARIRNTQEPSIYFNDAAVVQPSVNNRFFDTVPSHLVGLGILGTFLGLAAGVGLASGKLGSDSASPQEIQHALSQLLSGASLAFMTSIFGLGLSLTFLWIERTLVGSVHRRLNKWVELLEARVELVTPEHIALDQLEQQRRQTTQLERFNTDLVFALEKALDERVAQRLVPELDRVVQAIEGLRTDRTDSNVAAIERLVEQFSQKLTQSAGREMDQMGATLKNLGERLEGLVTALGDSQQATGSVLEEAARNLRDSLASGSGAVVQGLEHAVQAMTRQLQAASQDLAAQVSGAGSQMRESGQAAAQGIAGSLGAFQEGVARLDRVSASQAELAKRIEEMATGLRSAGETVIEAHRGFAGSLEPSRAVVRGLEAAGGRLAESLAGTGQLVAQVVAAGKSMQEEQQRMSETWQDYASRFQGIDQALQKAFEKLDEGVRNYTEQIRNFHSEVDQHMGKAIQSLASATAELQGSVEDLGERLPSRGR